MLVPRRIFGPLLLLAAALFLPSAAQAFRLVPIEMEFEPSGRNATQIFRVENEGNEPVAIEVRVEKRAMDRNGADILSEAYDDWVVFPEQIILQPKETQSIRVQYAGETGIAAEQPYRLIADQLPIDIGRAPGQGGQVRLLVRYVASLYVVPAGAGPDVRVEAARPASGPEGSAMLELVLTNHGTMRKMLQDPVLTVEAGSRSLKLTGEALTGLAGENLLAGTTRHFLVPWPGGMPQGPVSAALHLP